MIYRCIAPQWLIDENPTFRRVYEGEFTDEYIEELNSIGYNIYYLPNYPSIYTPGTTVDGSMIDTFEWVYCDMDLKEGKYASKEEFIHTIGSNIALTPSKIIDSGNGVHAYWRVVELDAMSFLRLQRRLMRFYKTDEAVGQIYQLLRVPNTINTKHRDALKSCTILYEADHSFTCEQLDKELPLIIHEDEEYCKQHFDKTYNIDDSKANVDTKLPPKFGQLMETSKEARNIWSGNLDDRSKGDFRLAHIMFAHGFTRDEATSVLVNCAKALSRAPKHRLTYAINIIDQIWTYELNPDKEVLSLSSSVREILTKAGVTIKGTRFPCWRYLDATERGFRLGDVIGLIAGSGVGKTAMALNMFEGFVTNNPDYDHFFVSLEQPSNEIADRWKTMCGTKEHLYDKVHVIGNYNEDGSFRHLSLDEIREYLLKFQKLTNRKVGCVVIDHIGALKKKGKNGENQDLMDICHAMKGFAVETNTVVVMQSQAPREKAGIGDLELNKDAAYGTVYFESYCDYVITIWQPLKRAYGEGAPTVTAFKFCKIRHKKVGKDEIHEDIPYTLRFESETEHLRALTQEEMTSFDFFNNVCTNKRKQDRKTDIVQYQSIPWSLEDDKKVVDNTSQ